MLPQRPSTGPFSVSPCDLCPSLTSLNIPDTSPYWNAVPQFCYITQGCTRFSCHEWQAVHAGQGIKSGTESEAAGLKEKGMVMLLWAGTQQNGRQ